MSCRPKPFDLRGWQDVARVLEVSVRTASRWEKLAIKNERPMPLKRVCGRILARTDELSTWLDEVSL